MPRPHEACPAAGAVLLLRPGRLRRTLDGMAVSDEVRQVEHEIDSRIRAISLWRCGRQRVVRATLDLPERREK